MANGTETTPLQTHTTILMPTAFEKNSLKQKLGRSSCMTMSEPVSRTTTWQSCTALAYMQHVATIELIPLECTITEQ